MPESENKRTQGSSKKVQMQGQGERRPIPEHAAPDGGVPHSHGFVRQECRVGHNEVHIDPPCAPPGESREKQGWAPSAPLIGHPGPPSPKPPCRQTPPAGIPSATQGCPGGETGVPEGEEVKVWKKSQATAGIPAVPVRRAVAGLRAGEQ